MSDSTEIILCWAFVGVLWILARRIGYREGFKDGYEQGEKDFKPQECETALRSVPSADRPQGEWIQDPINKNNMYCSNCKVSYTKDFLQGMSLYHEPKDMPNYCPNCGAHMKGADDETNY